MKTQLELLSPAKNLEVGKAAIDCGADAIYIGAAQFGARAAVGNSINDIEELVAYAHQYWVKVYVTINTILYDNELKAVKSLIIKLHSIGVDAIIFQDMALLKMDLPPIPLYASTQTHNYDLEKIKFLDEIGIQRIILARELSLEQLRKIKDETQTELEYFVHGALCVCMSGQCYLSFETTGRSANRGECSQPCRMKYSLIDSNGKTIIKDRYLLSLKDLNLSSHLVELIDVGVTSFKIEGRLKDVSYVKNITAYYRQLLDDIIDADENLERSSSGYSQLPFSPDPQKTFNRNYTEYFFNSNKGSRANINSPKSVGEYLGKVQSISGNKFRIDSTHKINNGDGLCYYDKNNELKGFSVNNVQDNLISYDKHLSLTVGLDIYRNYDTAFQKLLKTESVRSINTSIQVSKVENDIAFTAIDEDQNSVTIRTNTPSENSNNVEKAIDLFKKQLSKSGDTIFEVKNVTIDMNEMPFLPVAVLNKLRRKLLNKLREERLANYQRPIQSPLNSKVIYHRKSLDYRANVSNKLSEEFYFNHGVTKVETAFEIENETEEANLMRCKYCILDELNLCQKAAKVQKPYYLKQNKKKFRLELDCHKCEMSIIKI